MTLKLRFEDQEYIKLVIIGLKYFLFRLIFVWQTYKNNTYLPTYERQFYIFTVHMDTWQ